MIIDCPIVVHHQIRLHIIYIMLVDQIPTAVCVPPHSHAFCADAFHQVQHMAHPHKPGSQHMVSETLANQPGLSTFTGWWNDTLSQSQLLLYVFTNAFDRVLMFMRF